MNNNDLPRDDLLQFIFGELDDTRQAAVRKAVAEGAELAATARGLEAAVVAVRAENVGQVSAQFNDRLRQRMSEVFDHAQPETTRPTFLTRSLDTWRWIMRSPVSRATAAAIFVLAITGVGLWFHGGGATPAFADFLQPFLDAKTVKYKMTIEMTSLPAGVMVGIPEEMQKDLMNTTTEVMELDASRSRRELEMPGRSKMVDIWDGGQGKGLRLEPAEKRATVYNYANRPKDETPSKHPVGYAAMFRSALLDARDIPDFKRESLGEKEIDGRPVVGFRISLPAAVFNVWGDPKTGLPVRIEATLALMPDMKLTMSDFAFNVEMDESLFSVEPPAGYEVTVIQGQTINASPEEKDLIEVFRCYSELSGGRFPDLLDMMWLNQTVMGQRWLADHLQPQKTEAKRSEEWAEAQAKIQRGMEFTALLPKEADSHYAGKGVSLGAADTPIFWYRPKDAKKYRVIYADLSTRDADTPPSAPVAPDTQLENDVIEMFRCYSELSDGPFPDSLDVTSILTIVMTKNLALEYLEGPPKPSAKQEQEMAEALVILHRGLIFSDLLPKEADSHYAGKDVSLGAADTPIFWYRPKDSKKYRVIYADLSVRDAETPPSVPDAQPEEDLIDTFRYYSELSGGPFPDSLDLQTITEMIGREITTQTLLELAPRKGKRNEEQRRKIEELMRKSMDLQRLAPERGKPNKEQMDKIEEQMLDLLDWEKLAPGKGKPNKEQMTKIMEAETQKFMKAQMPKITAATTRFQRGLLFTLALPPEADAHYAGKGVSLGAADTPIFWYRPKDAKQYRVVYADLSVREAETPPSVPDAQPVPAPSSPKE
ncbi:MAG TPA: hypothetical protein VMY37_29750 [Thermoguttaceae bacterium]|nr:hypothetical protein [Thermoguttaceae bacterium]